MNPEQVLAKIDASLTGAVPSSDFLEGVHAQTAQKNVINLLAQMRREQVIKSGKDADGNTVYSRMTDAERAAVADRQAAKDVRRAELAAIKAAQTGGA